MVAQPLQAWYILPRLSRGSMLEVGAKAPRFVARNQDGREVRLDEYLGHKEVVLYFFPKDATPG